MCSIDNSLTITAWDAISASRISLGAAPASTNLWAEALSISFSGYKIKFLFILWTILTIISG